MNTIYLITGAPASGKSTISHLAANRMAKSIHIRVDQLREMVVAGVEMPTGGWTDETSRQFQLARTTAIQMAHTYATAGFTAIIDDVCVPEHFADDYAALPTADYVQRILLLPTEEALLERLDVRNGPHDQFLKHFVPWIYQGIVAMPKAGWHVLDSSEWTIEETVERVLGA